MIYFNNGLENIIIIVIFTYFNLEVFKVKKFKHLVVIAIMGSLLLSSSVDTVKVNASSSLINVMLPTFPVVVNYQRISNLDEKFPLLVYKDITYFPMTWNYAQALGLRVSWSNQSGFSVSKDNIKPSAIKPDPGFVNSLKSNYVATIPDFDIRVNGVLIDNSREPYPLFVFRDVTYFPMTWRFAQDEFDLSSSYNSEGFLLNSKKFSSPIVTNVPNNISNNIPNTSASTNFTNQQVYDKVSPAIVRIETYSKDNTRLGSASGIVVGEDGTILTNYRTISDYLGKIDYAMIIFSNGNKLRTNKLIGYNELQNIAVLKIEYVSGLKTAILGNSDYTRIGDPIYTIGLPLGSGISMSTGVITNQLTAFNQANYFQISAQNYPEITGGALINSTGQVIGVMAGTNGGQNINQATPINVYKQLKLNQQTTFANIPLWSFNSGFSSNGLIQISEKEPNDQMSSANSIQVNYTKEYSIFGYTNKYFDVDYYSFQLNSYSQLDFLGKYDEASMAGPKLVIVNASGQIVASSETVIAYNGKYNQRLKTSLVAGNYYLVVTQNSDWSLKSLYDTPRNYAITGMIQ
jgi:hypothetical protein